MKQPSILRVLTVVACVLGARSPADELPAEQLLWTDSPPHQPTGEQPAEQVRTHAVRTGSPSGSNRVFSSVSTPTYSIHQPEHPNGVGVVICPGGGFQDVWLDREGHDLALRLKDHGITSLVLKYRTRRPGDTSSAGARTDYQRAVLADGREAVRILRRTASESGLQPDKIGICGFSAGGRLALSCALYPEPGHPDSVTSGMPDFAGLFYPGIPDDITETIQRRPASEICPMFVMNARVDKLTPADRCVDFYARLLEAGVNAELHVYGKGWHGFDLGVGCGESAAQWPDSFVAWLMDLNLMPAPLDAP